MKKIMPLVLTALLLLPIGLQVAHADSSSASTTGTASITATCGLAIGTGAPVAFGSVSSGATTVDNTALTFSNGGSVTATTTVAGTDWYKTGSTVHSDAHITGDKTAFETTDQNSGSVFGSYASFTKNLNSTNTDGTGNDGFVTFGAVRPGTNGNGTFWALNVVLQNTPFSGGLTQTITFNASC